MTTTKTRRKRGFAQRHGLSAGVAAILCAWLLLYLRCDPSTHWGAFFGNATADWLGSLVIVIATKYCYEIGSKESRPPHPASRRPLHRFLIDHSLTMVLVATGALWIAVYAADGCERQGGTGRRQCRLRMDAGDWTGRDDEVSRRSAIEGRLASVNRASVGRRGGDWASRRR